jgi:hypothetical protein
MPAIKQPLLSVCLSIALLAIVTILLTACSDDPDQDASSGEDSPTSSPTSSPSGDLEQATRLADVAADTVLTPGRYAMGFSSDQADTPMALIDVPAGYRGGGEGYEIAAEPDGAGFRHFGTWTVAEVPEQPCGDPAWVDPGPSVDDLADWLAALPVWDSTQPAPRTIGGYEGVFMELNVPTDIPAECQGEPLSWRDHLGSTQGIGPGKTQHLWIVDVDGHRLMFVAGYFPGAEGPTPTQIDEMTQMAEGATFVDDDQVAP